MNPYLAVTLVMCGVIFIALVATAYMAVYFTRRARADLQAALDPLADVLGGQADIEEAQVTGRYHGKLAFGRMAHAEGGPVRVFQVEVIDAAGGDGWIFVHYPAKGTTEIRPEGSAVVAGLEVLARPGLPGQLGITSDWYQVEYSPEGGHVRLLTPMATRKDIPRPGVFEDRLAFLDRLSDDNRAIQEARTSTEVGDR